MLDTIQTAILEGRRNVFLTLPKLTSEEILGIWDTVSGFVEKHLSMNKGVLIPGLGTFSFFRQKFEVGGCKPRIIQRPVFLLSEKLAQIHGLKLNKIRTPGDIPIVHLNFIVLSLEGPFNRETVEGCIRETLLSFSRSIATKQPVEFTFKGIGVLIVRDNKVKMKFYKDFLQAMDGSGRLLKALSNRPGTGDSVLSNGDASSPRTRSGNTVVFPRIEAKDMETITEEGEIPSTEKDQSEKEISKKENLPPKRLLSRQAITPAKVSGVSLTEDLEKILKAKTSGASLPEETEKNLKSKVPVVSLPEEFEKNLKLKLPSARQPVPVPDLPKTEQEATSAPVPALRDRTSSPICQDHGRAGQEMCYLCLQREQRNVPLQLTEERRKKDREEDCILAQYQAMKDQEALQKQLMKDMMSREQSQKIAAFNLGISEAIRQHKSEKPPEAYKSYIFEKRPVSSTPHQKQEVYGQQLGKQLEEKEKREKKEKRDQDLIDRLEHVQLAEELAAQRAKFLKDKMEEMQCYKKALDIQVKLKPAPLPEYVPNSTEVIFGKNDMNNEKMAERRKRAQEYFKHQLQAAADHRRAAILSQLVDQRKAAEMIQKARKQWIAEKGARMEKIFQMNLALQEDWRKSAEMKRQRDYEEKLFQRTGDKLLLLDQCARYRRCYRCKKGLGTCGENNAWTDTKYVPGSRLVV
uniref:Coiled-coil domain containing 81 n=1 Tax=Anolis carolinensis TaxID=28377 RepID=G1KAY3_ANOCA|nr:PREDICTED: coiled-coil domain-containing protein 81 [Anolis carolinensis]|eukprot:XP_016848184.1 PREDICTED: coiled-coil domain-containing protein 81 [Anolis carolinensis]